MPRRRTLGDLLRRTAKAEDLHMRRGIRLAPWGKKTPGTHAYDIYDADGQDLGRLVLRVVKFRDVPDDEGFDTRDGLEVTGINLIPAAQRKGLGTKLYEVAAEAACELGLPLVSDRVRSPFAEAFWRKQATKGRAYPVEGSGAVFPSPRVEAEEHLYAAYLQAEIHGAGVRTEAELARKDPQRFARAQERVEAKLDAWREKLPKPKTSDDWAVERYVLDDSCKYSRDLSGFRRKKTR